MFTAKGFLIFADPYNEGVKHPCITKTKKPWQTHATIELHELVVNGL